MSFIPSSSPRGLPNELLYELANFAPYDALLQATTSNSRLGSFAKPKLERKSQKLRELYFSEVKELAGWMRAWSVRSAAVRKFVHLRVVVDSEWCERAGLVKKDLWSVNRARLTVRGMGADLGRLHTMLSELGHTLCQILESHSSSPDWLSEFRLGPSTSDLFRSARFHLLHKAAKTVTTELAQWTEEDLPVLERMLSGLGELLQEPYIGEMFNCQNEYHACTQLTVQCSTLLGINLSWMK